MVHSFEVLIVNLYISGKPINDHEVLLAAASAALDTSSTFSTKILVFSFVILEPIFVFQVYNKITQGVLVPVHFGRQSSPFFVFCLYKISPF